MSASWARDCREGPRCTTRPVYCDDVPEDDWGNLASLGLLVHVYSYVCCVHEGILSPRVPVYLAQVERESADFVALALCVAFG